MVQVSLNVTLFFQIVQFLIIILIVNFLIVKPIRATMLRREGKINALKEKSAASLAAIEQKALEYDEKLKVTRAEIAEYQEKLRADANIRSQTLFEKVKTESNATLAQAREQISSEAKVAREKLDAQTEDVAKLIVQMVTK